MRSSTMPRRRGRRALAVMVMALAGLVGGFASGSSVHAQEKDQTAPAPGLELVGDWRWEGDEPLVNRAQPGVNDAVAVHEAPAADGLIMVRRQADRTRQDDQFFRLGPIDPLRGAQRFALTLHGLTLEAGARHVLFGGSAGTAEELFPGSLFYVDVTSEEGRPHLLRVVLWGQTSDGEETRQNIVAFGSNNGITFETGRTYDLQVLFDGTSDVGRNVAVRLRDAGEPWGGFVERPSKVRTLNDADTSFFIGKYSQTSSIIADFTLGRVTLHAE